MGSRRSIGQCPARSCPAHECRERAADIVVVQNGMWLTALLGVDKASIQRSLARTEEGIAFAA